MKKKEPKVNHVQPPNLNFPYHPLPYPSYRAPYFPTYLPYNYPAQTNTSLNPAIQVNNIHPPHAPTQPTYTNRPLVTQATTNQGCTRLPLNLPSFPKLSISNANLFQQLFDAHVIIESPARPMGPPFPAWYNPNVTCQFT